MAIHFGIRISEEEPHEIAPEGEEAAIVPEDAFFETVGRPITYWVKLESGLVAMAGILLDAPFKKAGLVLYSINNFYTWLTIIDDLFAYEEKRFGHLRDEWGQIAERLKKMNDVRVRLAHHTTSTGEEIDGFPVLRPPRYDGRTKSGKYKPLSMEELLQFGESIHPLMIRIIKLLETMNATKRASLSKPRAQLPHQPPLEDSQ